MATIKLSGGKVVLKSGKVSCSCCEELCCLYPFPEPSGTPLYPDTDLPDAILWVGLDGPGMPGTVTLTRAAYVFDGSYIDSITAVEIKLRITPYIDVTGAQAAWNFEVDPDNGGGYVVTIFADCLIFPTYSEDLFPNTLTVNGTDAITRDPALNLCLWTGGSWTLRYNSTTYKFQLNGVEKDDPQNTPIGTYGVDVVS